MSCCAEHQIVSSGSSYMMAMWTSSPYLTTVLVGPFLLAALLAYPALLFFTPKEQSLAASACKYITASDKDERTLPKLMERDGNDDEIQLSIVIPAFNEKDRLPSMLDEALKHLESIKSKGASITSNKVKENGNALTTVLKTHHDSAAHKALREALQRVEIIVVDDGSTDSTANDVIAYAQKHNLNDTLRLVRLGQNCGKGKAVRHGVLHARGALIAFCDADGATRFSDLGTLANELQRIITPYGQGIVCGSRAHLVGTAATVKRSLLRNFLMHSFHLILSLLMRPPNPTSFLKARLPVIFSSKGTTSSKRQSLPSQPPIRDTQCGFKLFTRQSAQAIFPLAHIDRWIFDVELLLLAETASHITLRETAGLHQHDIDAKAKRGEGESTDTSTGQADPLLRLPLPISEVAVDWREVEGSKIDVLTDSVKMGLDLIVIRLNYALGRWRSPSVLPGYDIAEKDACCR